MTNVAIENRLALIHRVITPDEEGPREYAILITNTKSIFIRQKKTRRGFVLRGEMRFGTALVTDVKPKTIEDYNKTSLESLTTDTANISVPHEAVSSLALGTEEQKFRARDFFVWLTMRRQGHKFQVYDFEMRYQNTPNHETMLKFYMVPLGEYFKPKRQTSTREAILREYAMDALEIFKEVLPDKIISD
jgi:hypothetical protein